MDFYQRRRKKKRKEKTAEKGRSMCPDYEFKSLTIDGMEKLFKTLKLSHADSVNVAILSSSNASVTFDHHKAHRPDRYWQENRRGVDSRAPWALSICMARTNLSFSTLLPFVQACSCL